MSLLVAPARVHGARAIASRSAPRLNPLRAATLPPRPARSARRVAASASLSSTAPALFELAGNANQLVDGCGVNGTCGQVAAPPSHSSEAPSSSARRCSSPSPSASREAPRRRRRCASATRISSERSRGDERSVRAGEEAHQSSCFYTAPCPIYECDGGRSPRPVNLSARSLFDAISAPLSSPWRWLWPGSDPWGTPWSNS